MARVRFVVVGGGITGLAAAHRLLEHGVDRSSVVVLEADDRLGGQIRTERHGEILIEAGPDTLVAQKPAAVALCERLGLGAELEEPGAGRGATQILHRGRLIPVPRGFLMMAPTSRRAVLASPLFSWGGKLRMLAEPWVRRRPASVEDESLASFVTRRFGAEALDRVAEPVVASLFTADADRLSLRMTLPRFLDLEAQHGNITPALRRAGRAFGHGTGRGGFVSMRGGLERIVVALASRLAGSIRTRARLVRATLSGGGWTLALAGGETIAAEGVIFACPGHAAAKALADLDAPLAEELSILRYAPCATVNVAYRRADVGAPLSALGFFVPRTERSAILACSYVSEKFAGRAPRDLVVLRAFLGGATRPGIVEGDDAALTRVVHDALRPVLAISGEPVFARVHRFARAMPQFEVGASAWVERVRDRANAHPGLVLVGSVTGAVGLPDCIRSGEEAADRLASRAAAVPVTAA